MNEFIDYTHRELHSFAQWVAVWGWVEWCLFSLWSFALGLYFATSPVSARPEANEGNDDEDRFGF